VLASPRTRPAPGLPGPPGSHPPAARAKQTFGVVGGHARASTPGVALAGHPDPRWNEPGNCHIASSPDCFRAADRVGATTWPQPGLPLLCFARVVMRSR